MFRGDFTSVTKHTNTLRRNFSGEIAPTDGRFNDCSTMVSTGKRVAGAGAGAGAGRESPEEDMERLKPLHNFDLPWLKWGNQKLLRCMKVESNGDVSVVDRNRSSESRAAGGGGGGGGGTRRRDLEFEKRFRSSCYRFPSPERVKSIGGIAGDGEIEATREKLMFDFQKEVGKMKDAILRERLVDPPPPAMATATTTTENLNPPADRPWNLRTRRAACKAPRSPATGVDCHGEVSKPNSSPARIECKFPNLRPTTTGVAGATTSGEKRERPKFSISLSRRELEEDFMAMAGRRLPRKPKKRPRVVQKQLDTLFPGLWLSEITADLYKVPDETDAGKR